MGAGILGSGGHARPLSDPGERNVLNSPPEIALPGVKVKRAKQRDAFKMVKGYSRVQIALHWAVAAFIVFNLLMGEDMSHLWRDLQQGGTAATTTGAWAHIIAGSLVLALVVWRLILRFTRGVPAAPAGESRALRLAGEVGHLALYVLMIALPVTGLLAWYGGVTSVSELHGEVLKLLLWLVIIAHVVAAAYHQFVRKDGLMDRMRKPLD